MIVFIDRVVNKLLSIYRKAVFRKKTNCDHNDFTIVGKLTLINYNVKIGRGVCFFPDVMLHGDGPIVIGDNVDLGNGVIIYASKTGGVTIGDDVCVAAHSYIIDTDHGIKAGELIRKQENTVANVIIGNDVWLGSDVSVLKGSKIGDGAVIGAKSLVKGEIPDNAIAFGAPARVKRFR